MAACNIRSLIEDSFNLYIALQSYAKFEERKYDIPENFVNEFNSLEELLEKAPELEKSVEVDMANVNAQDFKEFNFWHARFHFDDYKVAVYDIVSVTYESNIAVIILQRTGDISFDMENENVYFFNDYVFRTSAEITNIEIKFIE